MTVRSQIASRTKFSWSIQFSTLLTLALLELFLWTAPIVFRPKETFPLDAEQYRATWDTLPGHFQLMLARVGETLC